jgi:glycosyltransferase involved in cell wall biosynthesis
VETYTRNIIRALAQVDPEGDYTLFSPQPFPLQIPGVERMRHVVVPSRLLFGRVPVSLPLALLRERIDLLHAELMAPVLTPVRIVVTLYDLSYERYPDFFATGVPTGFRQFIPRTVRRAAVVLTISEFSKQDIVRFYRVPPEKVVVTLCAADPIFRPLKDEARLAAVRARYGTGDHFILCVGDLQPRKNLKRLITAYVKLRQADATRHKLVLVGRKAWLYDEIFAVARASGYVDELIFTAYVPDDDLVALYNAADLFVYPSIFEGFGLPPLEAMACGTPVITSNTSSLPEVVGDAALMVDPINVEALASAMVAVLGDTDLQTRLSACGLQRAAAFSWEATARTILRAYHMVEETRRGRLMTRWGSTGGPPGGGGI